MKDKAEHVTDEEVPIGESTGKRIERMQPITEEGRKARKKKLAALNKEQPQQEQDDKQRNDDTNTDAGSNDFDSEGDDSHKDNHSQQDDQQSAESNEGTYQTHKSISVTEEMRSTEKEND